MNNADKYIKVSLQSTIRDSLSDAKVAGQSLWVTVLSNRGFQALFVYRLSHFLYIKKIPLIPLVLTRIIQVLYAIDIDWRAMIAGGVIIRHGVGVVIGQGVVIHPGVKIYQNVTLGISESGKDDGFPIIEKNVIIGAGAKLLGKIKVGSNAKIGANAVVLKDIPDNATAVGVPAKYILFNDEKEKVENNI